MLSLRYGARAVERLANGESGVMVALSGNRMTTVPLGEVAGRRRFFDSAHFDLEWMLSRLPLADGGGLSPPCGRPRLGGESDFRGRGVRPSSRGFRIRSHRRRG